MQAISGHSCTFKLPSELICKQYVCKLRIRIRSERAVVSAGQPAVDVELTVAVCGRSDVYYSRGRAFRKQVKQQPSHQKITKVVYREGALDPVFSERTLAKHDSC